MSGNVVEFPNKEGEEGEGNLALQINLREDGTHDFWLSTTIDNDHAIDWLKAELFSVNLKINELLEQLDERYSTLIRKEEPTNDN